MKKYLQLTILMLVTITANAQTISSYNIEDEDEIFNIESHNAEDLWILDSTYHYAGTNLEYAIYNEHDGSGNLTTSVSRYRNEETNNFETIKDSIVYTYNGNYKASRIIFTWNRNLEIWSDTVRYSEYNSAGDPTRVLYRSYDEDTNTFNYGSDAFSLYNADGNIVYREFVTWDATVQNWYKSGKDDFFYDSNNLLIRRVSEYWNSDLGEYSDNNIYYYENDANGVLLNWKRESWFTGINQWFEVENRSYIYNMNGDVTHEFRKKFDYQNLVLIGDRIVSYHYDNDKLSKREIKIYDINSGNYIESKQYFNFYDANGLLVAFIGDRYDAATGQWSNILRDDFFYSLFVEQTCYIENTVNADICSGDAYIFGGVELNEPGSYIDTIQNELCDTISTLILGVLAEIELTNSVIVNDDGTGNGSISIEIDNQNGEFIYTWTNGENSNSIEGLASGEYCCTVTNEAGCENVFCFIVEPSCFVEYELNTIICIGEVYTFGGEQLGESGSYIDTVLNNQCDTIVNLNLIILPEIELTNSEVNNENGTGNGSISIEINNQNGAFTYTWTNGGNTNSIEGLTSSEYCCTVTNEAGCENVFCFDVELENSISNLIEDNIVVFPNPSHEGTDIQVSINGYEGSFNTQVYNTIGQKVFSGIVTNKIDYKFKKGLYFVVLEIENESVIKKLIVD